MDWWKDVRTNDAITEMAFDTLTQMFTNNDGGRTGLSKKRLTEYEKKGHFLNFNNKKPKDFYVSFPDLSQTIERETLIKTATPTSNKRSGVSTLRGGRKNQRKTRSNRRTLSLS
jgi:hypothetical protein